MSDIDSQTLQESSREVDVPAPRSSDPVAEVEKLLNPAPAPDQQEAPETEPLADLPGESWDLKSVAERLKADPATLYESLKVALENGEEITVSALKDAYKPAAEIAKAREVLVEEMTSSKQEVLQATQELAALIGLMDAGTVSREMIQEAGRQSERNRQDQAERLLAKIPEWKDPISKAADWADIRRIARDHGYTDAEVKLAEMGYADHRMVTLMRSLARGPKPAPTAKPAPKVAAKPAPGKLSEGQRHRDLKAAVNAGRMSQVAAVEKLLRGN